MTTEQMDDMDDANANHPPPKEPSAASRQMARGLRDMYVALIAEGFSEKQAITLIAEAISASIAKAAE